MAICVGSGAKHSTTKANKIQGGVCWTSDVKKLGLHGVRSGIVKVIFSIRRGNSRVTVSPQNGA